MDAGRVAKNHLAVVFVVVSCGLAVAAVQAGELHQAASRGDLAAVDALLLAGSVDLDKSDAIGTPLHHAIMGQYYRVARRLIAAGANLNVVDVTLGTPLYLAVREGDEAATRLLITAGADLEAQGALGTPLHLAAQHDLVNIVTLLLEGGAEVDARNRELATPLALAAGKGSLYAAKVLLAKGADIEAKDVRDQTPLFYAVVGPNAVNVVPLLIQRGVAINVRDTAGITALPWPSTVIGKRQSRFCALMAASNDKDRTNAGCPHSPRFRALALSDAGLSSAWMVLCLRAIRKPAQLRTFRKPLNPMCR